jgi:hypothetical protein
MLPALGAIEAIESSTVTTTSGIATVASEVTSASDLQRDGRAVRLDGMEFTAISVPLDGTARDAPGGGPPGAPPGVGADTVR